MHAQDELILSSGSSPSDEDLVLAARDGDADSLSVLLCRYMRSPFRLEDLSDLGLERDDQMQEAMIALLRAVRTYNADRGVQFKTYAAACIRNRLSSVKRNFSGRRHQPLNRRLPHNPELDSSDLTPETIVINREQNRHIESQILSLLSAFERKVLIEYLNGASYRQIAKSLGSGTKAVDNALQRIRSKLKRVLL